MIHIVAAILIGFIAGAGITMLCRPQPAQLSFKAAPEPGALPDIVYGDFKITNNRIGL